MKLSKFKFNLPNDSIALYPVENRDEAKLLILNKRTGKIEHRIFKDIISHFEDSDVMVFNNTKVFPARLYGNKEKTGACIEVFLIRELNKDNRLWDVLVDPARKIRIGNKLYFGEDNPLVAEVIDNTTSRGRTIRFLFDGPYQDFKKQLFHLGETPLPSMVKRKPEELDTERYQTIYAKHEGAVVAPTAGLHFSRELLKRLEIKGVKFGEITLHAGLGNFKRIDVEDLSKHKIDLERMTIEPQAVKIVNKGIDEKKKICAIGTTVTRSLESAVTTTQHLKEFEGWVNTFIYPPYDFKIISHLVTNFHLPQSIPFIMAATFGGLELTLEAYNEAMKEKYRFGTYGDAMLIIDH